MEYFEKGISIIEWGEIIENVLPKDFLKISFSKDSNDLNTRYLNLKSSSDKFNNLLLK